MSDRNLERTLGTYPGANLEWARDRLAAADARFGHHWWAPLGYLVVLAWCSVRALVRGPR